jgi:hypothetical protein
VYSFSRVSVKIGIGACKPNDRNLLFSGVAAEVGVLNDRNLLFSGVAAEVGVLGGGGEIVSVDRVI